MKALLHSLLEAAALGRSVVLCTVVHSGGSAPRSAGAHMAVFADGSTRGTVGGGRLELLAAKEGLSLLQRQTSALRAYDLSEREGGIGMACGGNVIVSYLYLGPEQADFVRAMAAAFDATAPCWLKLVIAGDGRTDVSLTDGTDRSLCGSAGLDAGNACCLYRAAHAAGARLSLRRGACRAGARAGAGICRLCRDGL